MKSLQLTLGVLKPHVVKCPPFLQEIRNMILTSKFKIIESKRYVVQLKEAELFYADHKNKFFYNRLITSMTSGPSDFYILAREDAILHWRQLMGPTKFFKTQFDFPESIRGQFGLSDTRNATHGSDSPESVKNEIGLFFPSFNIKRWYDEEEAKFRMNQIKFIKDNFVHKINNDAQTSVSL